MKTAFHVSVLRINQGKEPDRVALPTYQTPDSAGMDLHAAVRDSVTIEPGATALIPTGLAIALPPGYEAQVRPRSGLALKHSVTVLNTPGTIDADYRGEIAVILINHGKQAFVVERHMRIAQMVIAPYTRIAWQKVEHLPETSRGAGGYGSTGV
ncbi:dUTP diphosphatase [bacterium (Candidatus Blackallbacteria) CG17_big_fil_post_rev_8_21_14_2_50_48_46]|uniref:Deoxyuridine 5'-triphosphate nucleotidohydrolase n=1 Tax=bacterium (Candidatus Blackallbacteria) CG17_big_fil_post_rev_8_21_14_2_50_48_46 TaxID=2014261 RepID=A0A2M7G939_9BACT|nr:MAG: dUTP diphosphatase [bacterium (Candidatus Blackallbacteria) CG18_big_fil_WC_8_21_14_2_50_49_26]PIW18561.1 MAG: dUTP diphosphatase [bacterium (Candidatus Blackallbacteria) CG17_big_fil_post_rev_8_21_14_2_50_48_46]PIW46454.1 MAG: dUTP diphosphatase [bacterium (Candidatus Blackallbacteria) CG13_big_fil_rev_8_21_14_2_50_49_14]